MLMCGRLVAPEIQAGVAAPWAPRLGSGEQLRGRGATTEVAEGAQRGAAQWKGVGLAERVQRKERCARAADAKLTLQPCCQCAQVALALQAAGIGADRGGKPVQRRRSRSGHAATDENGV